MSADSFVTVRHAFAEYQASRSAMDFLTGRKHSTRSALRDISFSLDLGSAATVFGVSGAGKTTLLRMLTGGLSPRSGTVFVNGKSPKSVPGLAAGYVSAEESEPARETVNEVLHAYGKTHGVDNLPARIGAASEILGMEGLLARPAMGLSSTQRLQLNLARAAVSNSPLILLDDIADELGVAAVKAAIENLFEGRTVLVTTRFTRTAEELDLPIMLLHSGTLAQYGTCEDIAGAVGCRRLVDVWIEGLEYSLLRRLRAMSGVEEVRLLPTDQFDGQRLRVTLISSRYLPALYDEVSQSNLVKVEELPPSLTEIISQL